MDIEIILSYYPWNEDKKRNFLLKYPEISKEEPKGVLFREQRLHIFGRRYDEETKLKQESLLANLLETIPRQLKYEVNRRQYAHHDYAIQQLFPAASGMGGIQCPQCKKFMKFPSGTTWTGSKFFCPHCGYTVDTHKEYERQYDKEEVTLDNGSKSYHYVNWHEPKE